VTFLLPDTSTTHIYTLSLHDALPIFDACDHKAHFAGRQLRARLRTRREHSYLFAQMGCLCRHEADFVLLTQHAIDDPHKHHDARSEEHTSELQSRENLVCRLLLEKKK